MEPRTKQTTVLFATTLVLSGLTLTLLTLVGLIEHAYALCDEYRQRFGKRHTCEDTIDVANVIFPQCDSSQHTPFARAMPEEYKFDDTITTFEAYKMYLVSKPWLAENYRRIPTKRPDWV